MQPIFIISLIAAYFLLLIFISYLTGKEESNESFFKANRQSPWYVVAFGMIGATLSGVTFISVPGWVEASSFSYMQMVLGYILGYFIIGTVLLPLYYRLNLTSIYTYLEHRFGNASYKTGAGLFLISRIVGASFRLFLVANVLQVILFDALGVPFWVTVTLTIILIWLYTFKSGIKTIVYTDTLQTLFMLVAVVVAVVSVYNELNLAETGLINFISNSDMSRMFFFDDVKSAEYFWKQFFSGAFIAVVMTGLDQDMMQKNLTCRSLKDAQKNMFWFTIVLTIVNLVFLVLGLLLTEYAVQFGIDAHRDDLFAILASEHLGTAVFVFFLIGLIAAAYSSADSALTSLTTSFSVDIVDLEKRFPKEDQVKIRKRIHILFSVLLILVIITFKYVIKNESVIAKLFTFAGYTYGPLLGLYSFGLFTKLQVRDRLVPIISLAAPVVSYLISDYCLRTYGFDFGFFILILNGALTFTGLLLISRKGEAIPA
ncbi:sodium:solute symporter [Robertkochia marina]|uniref:Sodium:solute symporter n=1 Tax=Robertkochia marina TaxID=1227945 RepID=A0A4S3LWX1_9FLAO|nr:sodium:solute symporter [Robertkochia marina]THD65678.1 sodium:solute symporter [Robertkochia marina]TRZ46638.1 sodium:solute symporter [Robertkochia marina]